MGIFPTPPAIRELISQFVTLNDAFIAIDVLTIIAVIEGVIILDLTKRASSLRKLFKAATPATTNHSNNSSDKETPTRNSPDNQKEPQKC